MNEQSVNKYTLLSDASLIDTTTQMISWSVLLTGIILHGAQTTPNDGFRWVNEPRGKGEGQTR